MTKHTCHPREVVSAAGLACTLEQKPLSADIAIDSALVGKGDNRRVMHGRIEERIAAPDWSRMDGAPLDSAYTAAKNGDAAVLSADFARAASYFREAASYFENVRDKTPDNPSSRTLQALAGQYRDRAEYFSSGKASIDTKKYQVSPSSSTSAYSKLTSADTGNNPRIPARSPWNEISKGNRSNFAAASIHGGNSVSTDPSKPSQPGVVAPLSEALTSIVLRSQTVFLRNLEHCLNEKGVHSGTCIDSVGNSPSESFYLVKPKPSKGSPASVPAVTSPKSKIGGQVTLSSVDRSHAIEKASQAQISALKTGLKQVLRDLALQEQRVFDEHTEEMDRLRAENDRLKIQVSKLKTRWDDLKESARKRQGGDP